MAIRAAKTRVATRVPSPCGPSGTEVRRYTSGASGCIGGLQAREWVPAPPGILPIATLPRDCPTRPSPPSPSSSSEREARVADRAGAPNAWSALYGLLPQRSSTRIAEYHPTASASPVPQKLRSTIHPSRRHGFAGHAFPSSRLGDAILETRRVAHAPQPQVPYLLCL